METALLRETFHPRSTRIELGVIFAEISSRIEGSRLVIATRIHSVVRRATVYLDRRLGRMWIPSSGRGKFAGKGIRVKIVSDGDYSFFIRLI